jgi:O-antigen ligase/polysaccharide polymerase Wzy-like membrane protein
MAHETTLASQPFTINKYLPIAVVYFFFNGVFLPLGLLYTTILTPLLILWLINTPRFKYIWLFFPILGLFALVHVRNEVNTLFYLKSSLLLFSVYVFCLSFYEFLTRCTSIRDIYKKLLLINSLLVVVALIALFTPSLTFILWYNNQITSGFSRIKRLQLLTYEPSYYSTLLVPIALYYYTKAVLGMLRKPIIFLILVSVPLILSLSFGVIFGTFLAMAFMILLNFKHFFPRHNLVIIIIGVSLMLVAIVSLLINYLPENVFVIRMRNVFAGHDTSFRGRTFDSFILGWDIASEKNIWFGTGPGQVKVVGLDNFRKFYNYDKFTVNDISIPNSLGDTLGTFGAIGLLLRLLIEVILFFRTRVYNNYYRLTIFLFIFIYQFTGSFITNIAEYVLWIIAFYPPLFYEFDKRHPKDLIIPAS